MLFAFYLDHIETSSRQQAIMTQERLHVSQQAQIIHQTFEAIISDLVILSKHNDFTHLPTATDKLDIHLAELAMEFRQFHMHKPQYDQVRLIGPSGMEMIRTDRDNGHILIRPKHELQSKAERNYFRASIQLDKDHIHLSRMDLNMEHKSIEMPPVPTVRIAMPIFDYNQHIIGVLTLNYRAEHLFGKLIPPSGTTPHGELMLLNRDGYWLKHPDSAMEWGFILPDGADNTLKKKNSQMWNVISSTPSGQLLREDGLYTYTTVKPVQFNRKAAEPFRADLPVKTVPQNYSWILLSHVPAPTLNAIIRPSSGNYFVIVGLLLIAWAAISRALARNQQASELAQLQLAEKDMHIRNIVDSAFNGIITINERGIIESFNPAATRMFGYSEAEAIGQNVSIIAAPPDDTAHDHYLQRFIDSGEAHIINRSREVTAIHKNGHTFPVELFVTARKSGDAWQFIGMLHDITERKQMEKRLKALAVMDGLTGVHNRSYFNAKLDKEFKRASRYKQPLSLLVLDADHFKSVNDEYGHQAGDALLIALAKMIKLCARETDVVARYGGEEFAVILPETEGRSALQLAERLRSAVESLHIEHDGNQIGRTVSIGVASMADEQDDDDLLKRADQALYEAKEHGRNNVVLSHA